MGSKVLILCLDMDFTDPPWDKNTGAGHLYVKECVEILKEKHIETLAICRRNAKEKPERELFWSVTLQRIQIWEKELQNKEWLLNQEDDINETINCVLQQNQFSPDLIHAFYWYSWRAGVYLKKKYPNTKLIYSIISLGKIKHQRQKELSFHDNERERNEQIIFNEAKHILAVSTQEKENTHKLYNIPESKISVVGRGVDINLFTHDVFALKNSLLFVGRLIPSKGYDWVLKIYEALLQKRGKRTPRLFLIWGTFKEIVEVQRQISSPILLNAQKEWKIIWKGKVERSELPIYYNQSYLTLVPSYYEPWARVILESMACGTPVIMTPTGYADELIETNINWYVAPFLDFDAWLNIIERHLDKKKLQSTMIITARQSILRQFSMQVFNARQWNIYKTFIP